MGTLAGAMVLGGVLGALPVAKAANRLGTARTLAICLMLGGVFLVPRLLDLPLVLQWTLAAVSGLFISGWTVLIFPLIAAAVKPDEQTRAFQILFSLATGSGCVGALLGGSLPGLCLRLFPTLSVASSQRMVLLLAAILMILSAFLLPGKVQAKPIEKRAAGFRPDRRLRVILAVSLAWAFLLGALNPFAGVFFQRQFQLPLPLIGHYFFWVQAGVAVAMLLAGVSRIAVLPRSVLFVGAQLLVAGSFFGLAAQHLWQAEAAYLFFMFAQQFSQPLLQSMLFHSATVEERNLIAGWNSLLTAIVQALAAQVFGVLWARCGYTTLLPLLALLTLLIVAMETPLLRRYGR
jgi:MFS family permease